MREIAILRDGYSDFLVIKKLISTLCLKHKNEVLDDINFLDLEILNITNALGKYAERASKSGVYSFHTADAQDLIKELIPVYFACYKKTAESFPTISIKTIIVINTDAEKLLVNRSNYFSEWAYHLKGILYYSIEQFYEKMILQAYNYELLPYYIPLIPFPSSEIIVASCKYDFDKENLREIRPSPGLKMKVYNCAKIPHAIESGSLMNVLDECIVNENISAIYRQLPETRMLIHALSL